MNTAHYAPTPLMGVDYPARKRQLIHAALNNGASREVRALLENLPEQEYETPLEVMEALQIRRSRDPLFV